MKKKNKDKKPKEEKPPVISPSMEELLEGFTYVEEQDCFKISSGHYVDILHTMTKDLKNAPDEEIDFDIFKYSKYYKTQGNDIKIISSNFPANTKKQLDFVQYKMDKIKNLFLQSFLARKEQELIDISKQNTSSEYYLCIYEEKLNDLITSRMRAMQILRTAKRRMIKPLELEKRVQILHKLGNKNMVV